MDLSRCKHSAHIDPLHLLALDNASQLSDYCPTQFDVSVVSLWLSLLLTSYIYGNALVNGFKMADLGLDITRLSCRDHASQIEDHCAQYRHQ